VSRLVIIDDDMKHVESIAKQMESRLHSADGFRFLPGGHSE
jgi:hypothetical protein